MAKFQLSVPLVLMNGQVARSCVKWVRSRSLDVENIQERHEIVSNSRSLPSHMSLREKSPITIGSRSRTQPLVFFYLILSEPIRFAYDMGTTKPCYSVKATTKFHHFSNKNASMARSLNT